MSAADQANLTFPQTGDQGDTATASFRQNVPIQPNPPQQQNAPSPQTAPASDQQDTQQHQHHFWRALRSGLGDMAIAAMPSVERYIQTKHENQRQAEEDLRRRQAQDTDFVTTAQDLGMKFVHNGLVREDLPLDDVTTIPGGFVRKAGEGGRQLVKHKTAEGETIQWEVPTQEERFANAYNRYRAQKPLLDAQAQQKGLDSQFVAQGTATGKRNVEQQDYVTVPPELAPKYGYKPGQKVPVATLEGINKTEGEAQTLHQARIQEGLQSYGNVNSQTDLDQWRQQYPDAAGKVPTQFRPDTRDSFLRVLQLPLDKQVSLNEESIKDAAPRLAEILRSQGLAGFQTELAKLPSSVAKQFEGLDNPQAVLNVATGAGDVSKAIEEKRYHDVLAKAEQGKLGVEQAKLALSQKEFAAKFGSAESRAAFTESVKKDPDSYFSLPPDMKPGVAMDLVSQGLTVPTQLPSDLKSRSASAGLTLAAVQRIKALLQDPDLSKSIGPIMGRMGNVEQKVGDTFFKSGPASRKEQQLRTELAYLKMQEARGLLGGRPASQLIGQLADVTPNTKMSPDFINGAFAALENSMKAVGNEAHAYSFGGAQGAAAGPAAASVPPAVKQALQGASPGRHTLSDNSVWVVEKDGSVHQ